MDTSIERGKLMVKKLLVLGLFASGSALSAHDIIHNDHVGHEHGSECGHQAVEHEGHVDFLHDGHMHHAHEGHQHEHRFAVNSSHPAAEQLIVHVDGHAHDHMKDGAHMRVQHGDHFDYIHDGKLHHPHGDHVDDHGDVKLIG